MAGSCCARQEVEKGNAGGERAALGKGCVRCKRAENRRMVTHDVMDKVAVVVLLSVFEAVPVAVSFGLRLDEMDAVAVRDGGGESDDVQEADGERLALGDLVLVRVADGEPEPVVDLVADDESLGVTEAVADLVEDSVAFGERELEMETVDVREAVGVLLDETVVDDETVLVEERETEFDADSVCDAVPDTVSVTLVVGVRDTVGVEVACAQNGRGTGDREGGGGHATYLL